MESVEVAAENSAVLSMAGDVDTATVPRLTMIVDDLLASDSLEHLNVDFTGNEFIDSIGLGLLVRVRLLCAQRGIALRLLDVPHRVRVMLQITGLTAAFVVEDSPS